jgi:hypothetical protein
MLTDCADPNCTTPGFQSCDAGCQLTVPCVPILNDPAILTYEYLSVHGRYIPTTPANPFLDGFVLRVSNGDGEVYRATLQPGDLQQQGGKRLRWGFIDHGARTAQATRGGIYRVRVKQRREPDGSFSYPFRLRAYGDMSKALTARMSTQVYIGNDVGYLTATWGGSPGRWRLTMKMANAGLEMP